MATRSLTACTRRSPHHHQSLVPTSPTFLESMASCQGKASLFRASRRQFKPVPCYPTASKLLTSNPCHTVPIWDGDFVHLAQVLRAVRAMRPRHAVHLTPLKWTVPMCLP